MLSRRLESQPEAAKGWSTRDMAKACGLNQSSISRIWRAFSRAPHWSKAFMLFRDPLFIEKVLDIVGLYLDPPDRVLVLCVYEKSQNKRWIEPHRCYPFVQVRSNDRTPHTRLRASRHNQSVCRTEYQVG